MYGHVEPPPTPSQKIALSHSIQKLKLALQRSLKRTKETIMKTVIFLLINTIFLFGCTSTKQTKENPSYYLGGFNGVFSGKIQQLKGIGYPFVASGDRQLTMMLVIAGEKVSVYTGTPGKPVKEVHLANLRIDQHKTNAVIYSMESESENFNEQDKGDWVETWNFTLTRKDPETVYVYLVRAVNNFKLPPETHTEKSTARFFYSWSGELTQLASIERIEN